MKMRHLHQDLKDRKEPAFPDRENTNCLVYKVEIRLIYLENRKKVIVVGA